MKSLFQVALAYPLSHTCEEHGFFARAIVGIQGMTNHDRERVLELFRSGKLKLLICTAVLEEGIDVPECSFVVRYSNFDTTKSHIQGSGRARNAESKVFYFENHPELEQRKAQHMEQVARDRRLAPTAEQLFVEPPTQESKVIRPKSSLLVCSSCALRKTLLPFYILENHNTHRTFDVKTISNFAT